MKRIFALVVGLALGAATPGLAYADPSSTRPAGHQQAVDYVISRALAQRGVPYTYGGGNANGPSQRPASVPLPMPTLSAVVPDASTTSLTGTPGPATTPGLGATPGFGTTPGYAAADPSANVVGFDASGLIVYAYAGVGLKLPRSSGEQYKVGWKVTPDQALPGDLIFFGPDGTKSVAMYLGNGQMLEATDPVVKVSPVRTNDMAPYLSRIIS
jgi:cell wall-associated NlpC family hydrolase